MSLVFLQDIVLIEKYTIYVLSALFVSWFVTIEKLNSKRYVQANLMEESQEELERREHILKMYDSLQEALRVMTEINLKVGFLISQK